MSAAIDLSTLPWLPQDIAPILAGRTISGMVPPRLTARFNRPPRLPLVKWSQTHRDMGKDKGFWSWRKTPHAVGILKALDHPRVETVVVCKTPQTGGTEVLLNYIGACIHQDPADMMIVTSDEDNARVLCKDRILPMIQSSPVLSSRLGKDDSDISGKRLSLQNMAIYLASANSPSQLASRACRCVLFDETDKYPPTASRAEADPISLGIARTTTFETTGRKIFLNSTPTTETGNIWKHLRGCQLVMHFWVPCPHCGRSQVMLFKNIKWDGGRKADANEIEAERLARYACAHCGVLWDDAERNAAVLEGQWRADSGGQERFADTDRRAKDMAGIRLEQALLSGRITSVGFHVPAWISPFSSLSQTAGAFLRAPHKEAGWRDFANRFEAMPWVNVVATRETATIMALATELDDGLAPEWTDVLLLGADTQDDGLWYEVRAFEFGPQLRSHGLRRGFVDSFSALSDVVTAVYQCADGRQLQIIRGFIDAMGHRTTEVYDWCRSHRHIWPIQGVQRLNVPLPDPTKLDRYPGGRSIPGGLLLQRLDSNVFKDLLAAKLAVNVDDPGAFTFGSGLSESHARQYIAEEVDPKTNYWTCPPGKANHLWDCSTYVMACAYKFGVQFSQNQAAVPVRAARPKPKPRPRRW